MAGPVDQDHAVARGKPVAERVLHRLQV